MTDNIINLKPWIARLQAAERNEQEYFAERDEQRREDEEQLENWDRYLESRGLTENDGPEDPDGAFISKVDREVNKIMAEFEALVDRQVRDQDDALAALDDIRRALDPNTAAPARVVRDPHPDEPLTLFEVVCLPELGGQLFSDDGIPGKTAVKTLRGEIAAGRLRRVPPLTKNIYVSRRTIKEWTEWRDPGNPLTSSGSSPNTPRTGGSGRTATGRSQTEKSALARDSALSLVNKLRQPGSSTK